MVLQSFLSKFILMKKQIVPRFSILHNSRVSGLNRVRKHVTAKKNVQFIYTEKDLGEGLLEAGVPAGYAVGKQQYNRN